MNKKNIGPKLIGMLFILVALYNLLMLFLDIESYFMFHALGIALIGAFLDAGAGIGLILLKRFGLYLAFLMSFFKITVSIITISLFLEVIKLGYLCGTILSSLILLSIISYLASSNVRNQFK